MVKNNFKKNNYTGYHEFGCLYCEHIIKPDEWPDIRKKTRCGKIGKRLCFLLNDEGYFIHEEWFCIDISNKKFPDFHMDEFSAIKNNLRPKYMYLLGEDSIREVSFKSLGIID